MGFQATNSLELTPPFGASFASAPVMLYKGQYQVLANANVGDTHVHDVRGGYAESDGVTIDTTKPFSAWSTDIDACDGMQYIRFRFTLIASATTRNVATIDSITIPTEDLNP
jgi:hypothetical protein